MPINSEVIEFGAALLDAKDLDPVYDILSISQMNQAQMASWLVAYSMFYHAGLARKLSEADDLYLAALDGYDTHPRSEERRHFRGAAGRKAIASLSEATPLEHLAWWYRAPWDFNSVAKRIKSYSLYGPWVAFKLADMGERIFRHPIDFSSCQLDIFKEPRAGAALAYSGDEHYNITESELTSVIEAITNELNGRGYLAPPWGDRPLNVQEAETILCKWKSHKHGHYPIGKDKKAVKEALERYGYASTLLGTYS